MKLARRFSDLGALVVSALMLLLVLGVGCAGRAPKPNPAATNQTADAAASELLRVGDQIQVRIETSSAQPPQVYDLVIDEEGAVTLPLIDRVAAVGSTTSELAGRIRQAYVPRIYVRCSVNVLVASRFFYVGGEIRAPGRYPWSKDVTLLKAINTAGGFTDFANRGKVELTRSKAKQNLDAEYIRQHPASDVAIQPGDSIYVPRSIF